MEYRARRTLFSYSQEIKLRTIKRLEAAEEAGATLNRYKCKFNKTKLVDPGIFSLGGCVSVMCAKFFLDAMPIWGVVLQLLQ